MSKEREARKKVDEVLKKADKLHREFLKHHEKACKLMDKADDHRKKQDEKDRKDESRGMKKAMDRSPAQRRALKGKSKKKRDEILGGEKANKKLRREHKKK